MNIIIPLGGKGERFSKNGYTQPKPLIPIFDKKMIEYVLDNLSFEKENDVFFIIYNSSLDSYDFSKIIKESYPFVNLIQIPDTKGAVETLFLGIGEILNNKQKYNPKEKCLILDCDTFYTDDIINIFRQSENNMVFYTKNYEKNPIYSYIYLDENSVIKNIKEKVKISDNANTGAYAFTNIHILYEYSKHILDNNITFNNEPYTSCVISEMINSDILFKGHELDEKHVFSLGTPDAVKKYMDNIHAFLFDLDGTLVITDDIYYDVWDEILSNYNIVLTNEIFKKFIQGNNDKYVLNTLLINIDISIEELSRWKDNLFIQNIDKIKIVDGIYETINKIKLAGNKMCIVTNCNGNVACKIIEHIKLDKMFDFIISSSECIYGKPHPEPYKKAMNKYRISNHKCIIFEDSKTGIISGNATQPKLLIGIETIYNKKELLNYGANMTIKNYLYFDIENMLLLVNKCKENQLAFVNIIKNNSTISNIKEIVIDNDKLKGGFIADVISYKIITHDNDVYSQILKYENESNNNLSIMANKLELYKREYYFYTNISRYITNIKIPKFYHLIKNDNGTNYGIVLENLIDKQYKINLNLNAESIDVTLKIVDRMAKLHSSFWNMDLKKIFPELKSSNDEVFHPFFSEFITERYELFIKKWKKTLNKYQIERCDELYHNFLDIQKSFSTGNHLTFIHGDIKSPNIFYDATNDNEPYFIDWQHCAIGKGVQDLIFFILESFDISNIESIFHITKHYYYKKLIENGIKNYTFNEYEQDIYNALCYIPFFTSIWFGTIPQDELIDKNFPYFLISKMFYLIEKIKN